jgi:hypothetical protein
MRYPLLAAMALAVALSGLAGCASEYAYGPPPPYADVDYMGYYDGYYGPFTGGYWGPHGYFYYSEGAGGRYHRDSSHHFRMENAPGYRPIQGHAPPPAARGHSGAPDVHH